MTLQTDIMYDNILVPTDGSDVVDAAAEHAIGLATNFDATVHALYAVEPESTTLPSEAMRHDEMHDEYVDWGEQITTELAERARTRGVAATATVTDGVPHEVISEHAARNDVDLIVMGTAGRAGWRERLLGSVTERTLRTASAPVLTIHDESEEGQ